MAARFHILTPDAQYDDGGVIERQTSGPEVAWSIFRERSPGPAAIPQEVMAAADAMVVWHEINITEALVRALARCRIIVRAGVGFDNIDLEATGAAGIPVCNTPDYGTSEVADHAMGLMLALRRGIVGFHQRLEQDPVGNFDAGPVPLMRRLRGTTLGIVGLGRIGIAMALRAKASGMRVIAYDPYAVAGLEIAAGVDRIGSLAALLGESDVVSLHCPLTEETRNLIDVEALRAMKPDALLINTARGAVVDIPALLAALEDGVIGGAGIDVLPAEPPAADDPLSEALRTLQRGNLRDRLIVTPHAAWASRESQADARRLAVETAMLYLGEGRLRNLVNAEFLTSRRQ